MFDGVAMIEESGGDVALCVYVRAFVISFFWRVLAIFYVCALDKA